MKISTLTAAALVAFATLTTPAHAAQATLVSCEPGQSVTGRYGYVGTYEVYGPQGAVQFERFFSSYCPFSINVQ